MTAFDWCLVGLWIFAGLTTVTQVGKPRTPMTPNTAAFVVLLDLALITGLLLSRGAL